MPTSNTIKLHQALAALTPSADVNPFAEAPTAFLSGYLLKVAELPLSPERTIVFDLVSEVLTNRGVNVDTIC